MSRFYEENKRELKLGLIRLCKNKLNCDYGLIKEVYMVTLTKNIMVKMRDGVLLSGDLYRPDTDDQYPAVIIPKEF